MSTNNWKTETEYARAVEPKDRAALDVDTDRIVNEGEVIKAPKIRGETLFCRQLEIVDVPALRHEPILKFNSKGPCVLASEFALERGRGGRGRRGVGITHGSVPERDFLLVKCPLIANVLGDYPPLELAKVSCSAF